MSEIKASPSPTIWLTAEQVAAIPQVSVPTVRRETRAGRLKAYRIAGGRLVRYRREDVDAWLSRLGAEAER